MTIPVTWVDAFSDVAFAGNPAAVCLLDEPLDDAAMQSIAFELGISETAYLTRTDDPNTFGLRWFSPATEIDLCGHATLASAHALRETGTVDGAAPLTFHTRSGALHAAFDGDRIELDFPADAVAPSPLPNPLKDEWPGRGRRQRLVRLLRLRRAVVGLGRRSLRTRPHRHRRDRCQVAAPTAAADAGSGADYVLRVFGPNVGIDEDPATGSAQCAAGPYWAAQLGRSALVARQLSARGATLYVRAEGERVRIARPRHHLPLRQPVLRSLVMDASTADLRALVEGHQAASPREMAACARISGRARLARLTV